MSTANVSRSEIDDLFAEVQTAAQALARASRRLQTALGQPAPAMRERGPRLAAFTWPGVGTFHFTVAQRRVVAALVAAFATHGRDHTLGERELIRASGERVKRLAEVFVGTGAWCTLIVPGTRPGTYRLATGQLADDGEIASLKLAAADEPIVVS